jgi:hypothetical protein
MNENLSFCSILALAGALTAQQTWKVNCNGAYGAQFTDLPAAVAAAAPGDTILIYGVVGGGCGGNYTAPTIDKPLHIEGFLVGLPPGNNDPTQILLNGTLHVMGIASGEQVTLSNIAFQHMVFPPPITSNPASILITDCAGSVLIEDFYYWNTGTPGQVIRIERSDHVVLRGSTFLIGGDSIHIIDSNLLLTNTLVQYNPPFVIGPYSTFTESLSMVRSNLTMVASVVYGIGGFAPQHATVMDSSILRIGASSFLQGGISSFASDPPLPWDFATAYQFVGTGPSAVYKDPRADALWGPPSPPPILTTIDETFHDWIVANESYSVRVLGPAGGFAGLIVGDMIAPVLTPLGALGLDPTNAVIVSLVALPQPDGFHSWTFFCPPNVPNGYAFCLQCLTLSPTGVLGLTEPSPLTVAWDKSRIP